MASFNRTGFKAFTAGGALAAFRQVHLVAGKLAYAGATDNDVIGVPTNATFADGDVVDVDMVSRPGTSLRVASGVINAPCAVFNDASGKVSASQATSAPQVGIALTSATADGDYIEVALAPSTNLAGIARGGINTDSLAVYNRPLNSMQKSDGTAVLPATAASGAFGYTPGTHGTNTPIVAGEAGASGGGTTDALRFQFALPVEYVAAGSVKVRVRAKLSASASGTCTLQVDAYASDNGGGVSANIGPGSGGKQNLTTAYANYDFVITATSLVVGSLLDIKVTGVCIDTATTALIQIGEIAVLADVKG